MTSFRLHKNLKYSFDNINEFNRSSQTSILNMLMKNYVLQESKKIKELTEMPRQITRSQRPETAPLPCPLRFLAPTEAAPRETVTSAGLNAPRQGLFVHAFDFPR